MCEWGQTCCNVLWPKGPVRLLLLLLLLLLLMLMLCCC